MPDSKLSQVTTLTFNFQDNSLGCLIFRNASASAGERIKITAPASHNRIMSEAINNNRGSQNFLPTPHIFIESNLNPSKIV